MKYLLTSFIFLSFYSCTSMKNFDNPEIINESEGYFFKVRDGFQLFIYDYKPIENYNSQYLLSQVLK